MGQERFDEGDLGERLLTLKEVMAKTNMGSSTIYRRIGDETFPAAEISAGAWCAGDCLKSTPGSRDGRPRTTADRGHN